MKSHPKPEPEHHYQPQPDSTSRAGKETEPQLPSFSQRITHPRSSHREAQATYQQLELFDQGLQPERVRLSWTRTVLVILGASGAMLKLSSQWLYPARVFLFTCSAAIALFYGLYMHHRYYRFTSTHILSSSGLWLGLVAAYVCALGVFGFAWVCSN